jgi:hypothetical protein
MAESAWTVGPDCRLRVAKEWWGRLGRRGRARRIALHVGQCLYGALALPTVVRRRGARLSLGPRGLTIVPPVRASLQITESLNVVLWAASRLDPCRRRRIRRIAF